MVDRTPSEMDDLFDFGLTPSSHTEQAAQAPQAQFPSRRAAREASRPGRAPSRREPRAAAPESRKLRRSEVTSVRASAPQASSKHPASRKNQASRKHPLSVLLTMGAVTGMFAVAGLPAYALSTPPTVAESEAPAEGIQSVQVDSASPVALPARDGFRATTPQQLAQMSRDALRAANNSAYLASGARELGDDYPWPYELRSFQGGGLSPLGYYYRECVDFVAWRLNRDAGVYAEPYKWIWSTMTPTGGNASQWKYAWEKHGWTVSATPVVGSVAWFASNHVAYVKEVLDGGFVLIEEYNYTPGVYGQRTLAVTDVGAFLYPPT